MLPLCFAPASRQKPRRVQKTPLRYNGHPRRNLLVSKSANVQSAAHKRNSPKSDSCLAPNGNSLHIQSFGYWFLLKRHWKNYNTQQCFCQAIFSNKTQIFLKRNTKILKISYKRASLSAFRLRRARWDFSFGVLYLRARVGKMLRKRLTKATGRATVSAQILKIVSIVRKPRK